VENCNSYLWWDKMSIYYHLRDTHNKMSIDEYEGKYMKDYKEKPMEEKSKATKDSNTIGQDKFSECQFSCNICKPGKSFHSRSKAGHHMKAIHKTNLKDYKEQHGSSLVSKINHTCQICAAVGLWDRSAIGFHLRNSHDNMPIKDYFNKYIDNFTEENEWMNKISFGCKECKEEKFSSKSRLELWNHVRDNHKMNEMEYRTIHGSIYGPDSPVSHTCQVCCTKLNWESISLKPHIELKHEMTLQQYADKYRDSYTRKPQNYQISAKTVTAPVEIEEDAVVLQWTAGSLYKCNLCQSQIAGLYQFKKHLINLHNSKYGEYEKTYDAKEFILFSGFHLCKICQKNVRHDYQHLKNHMKEHDLKIAEYINKHKPKDPKLVRKMKKNEGKIL